jgi:hypothetical protein
MNDVELSFGENFREALTKIFLRTLLQVISQRSGNFIKTLQNRLLLVKELPKCERVYYI